MATDHNARTSAAEGRASADALPVEDDAPGKDKSADSTPPRAGRTGKLGARAERPAETRPRKTGDGTAEPTRGVKPPPPVGHGCRQEGTRPPRDTGG